MTFAEAREAGDLVRMIDTLEDWLVALECDRPTENWTEYPYLVFREIRQEDDEGVASGSEGYLKVNRAVGVAMMKAGLAEVKRRLAELGVKEEEAMIYRAKAIADVVGERVRQVEEEGFDAAHDDAHVEGDLALAAASYAVCAGHGHQPRAFWRLGPEWWKPKTPRRDLVRAAALIIAEIERIDRAERRAKG